MYPAWLHPLLYARGSNGAPSTALRLPSLLGAMSSYSHTITARGGFESCSIGIGGTIKDALYWNNQLKAQVLISDWAAMPMWQGYLTRVDAQIGGEQRSLSLDGMQNRGRTRYTTVIGTPQLTATNTVVASTNAYGVYEKAIGIGASTAAAATNLRNQALAARGWPVMQPRSSIATGVLAPPAITLEFAGWYTALGDIEFEQLTTADAVTTAQVITLLGLYNVIVGATYFDTSSQRVVASGVSDTQKIEDGTTFRERIETLLAQGNSSGNRLAWGIYEDRKMTIRQWAGANPDSIDYHMRIGEGTITDRNGNRIAPWLVRPDTIIEVADLIDPAPVFAAADSAARYYIERVTFRIDASGWALDLEPAQTDNLDALLARIGQN